MQWNTGGYAKREHCAAAPRPLGISCPRIDAVIDRRIDLLAAIEYPSSQPTRPVDLSTAAGAIGRPCTLALTTSAFGAWVGPGHALVESRSFVPP